MTKIREKQTQTLEKAAAKGLKLGGLKKMSVPSKISLVLLVLIAGPIEIAFRILVHDHAVVHADGGVGKAAVPRDVLLFDHGDLGIQLSAHDEGGLTGRPPSGKFFGDVMTGAIGDAFLAGIRCNFLITRERRGIPLSSHFLPDVALPLPLVRPPGAAGVPAAGEESGARGEIPPQAN